MGTMLRRLRLRTRPRTVVTLLLPCVAAFGALPPPHAGAADQVSYHGGPLLASTTSYAIFWLPAGQSFGIPPGTTAGYESLVQRYLQDVGETSLYGLLTEYSVPPSEPIQNQSAFGGAWVDNRAYPHAGTLSDPLDDADIQAEIMRAVQINAWPVGRSSAFYIFLAAGIAACRSSGGQPGCTFTRESPTCGWHSLLWSDDQPVLYAVLPEVWAIPGCGHDPRALHSPNGDPPADAEISILSHEQFELVTDPAGNGWHDGLQREIADRCQQDFGPDTGSSSNVVLHGHVYWVQREWSNVQGACVLADAVQSTTTSLPESLAGLSPTPAPTDTAIASVLVLASTPTPTAVATPQSRTARVRQRDHCKKGYRLVRGKCRPRQGKG